MVAKAIVQAKSSKFISQEITENNKKSQVITEIHRNLRNSSSEHFPLSTEVVNTLVLRLLSIRPVTPNHWK